MSQRGETFDLMVRDERARQDEQFPPAQNGQLHGPEVWSLVLTEEVGEVSRAVLRLRQMRAEGRPVSGRAMELLRELVQVSATCRAFVEQDPIFDFLDPPAAT